MIIKRISSYPSGYLYFIFSRIIGLSVKPIFLMYLFAQEMKTESAMLSEIFLFLSGVFVLFAAPVHFEYYKLFFEKKKVFLGIRKEFNSYISNLFIHILLITPVVFLLSLNTSGDFLFSILLTLLLFIEKSFDEIQRFLQFSKDFISWSNIFLLKNLFPVIVAIIYNELALGDASIYVYMISSMLTGVFIFIKYVPLFARKELWIQFKVLRFQKVKDYLSLFKKRYFSKYLQGISRANILNIDKWIALWLYSKSLLSELMLVGQFSNIINIGTNYATVSHRRAELLHSKNNVSSLMLGYKVPIVAFSLLVIVMVVLFGFDVLVQKGVSELKTIHIIMIGTGYMFFSVTQILTEYLFWNGSMKKVLSIDIVYYMIVVSGGVYLYYTDMHNYITVFFLLGNLFRFSAQLLYVSLMNGKK